MRHGERADQAVLMVGVTPLVSSGGGLPDGGGEFLVSSPSASGLSPFDGYEHSGLGRGRVEHRNSQYAVYAAACMRSGLQPELLSDAGWWQTPLWQYAVFAVLIYSRAAAERLTVPLEVIARRIAARHDVDLPNDG